MSPEPIPRPGGVSRQSVSGRGEGRAGPSAPSCLRGDSLRATKCVREIEHLLDLLAPSLVPALLPSPNRVDGNAESLSDNSLPKPAFEMLPKYLWLAWGAKVQRRSHTQSQIAKRGQNPTSPP